MRPRHIVVPEREAEVQHAVGEVLLFLYQGMWNSLLAARWVHALWEFLTWAGEDSLLALSQESLTDPGQVVWASPLLRAALGLRREQ